MDTPQRYQGRAHALQQGLQPARDVAAHQQRLKQNGWRGVHSLTHAQPSAAPTSDRRSCTSVEAAVMRVADDRATTHRWETA